MTPVTSGYIDMTDNKNNKNGPATNIPTNPNTQEAEDLIKSNKSAMQQLMDVMAENNQLKEDLLDREAQLFAVTDHVNKVLTKANEDSNALYKELSKNLVVLCDMIKGFIEPSIQQGFNQIRTQLPREQKIRLSQQYRQGMGINPLNFSSPPSPSKKGQ